MLLRKFEIDNKNFIELAFSVCPGVILVSFFFFFIFLHSSSLACPMLHCTLPVGRGKYLVKGGEVDLKGTQQEK